MLLMLWVERVTGMMTNEIVSVSQDRDSSDGMATKQFLITLILFHPQINID